VHEFKYHNLRSLARPLAIEMSACLACHLPPAEVLVAVPLHPRRLRERGYNQAHLLALELGRLTGLPVAGSALTRRTDTPPQARAPGARARYRSVAAAFVRGREDLGGKRVILIDDVATTGATLDGCARALKEGGAASVWGLTVAREVIKKGVTDGTDNRLP
jgi:competence protein ComFC